MKIFWRFSLLLTLKQGYLKINNFSIKFVKKLFEILKSIFQLLHIISIYS